MIVFYDIYGAPHPLQTYFDYCIDHVKSGCDELYFCVYTQLPQYKMLYEECRVVTDENEWLIKQIDDDRIRCQLNFDFLKGRLYKSYRSESKLLQEVLFAHLPTGWTIEGANVSSIRRTIEFDFCTDYDVVYQCEETYNVFFVWKIKEKRLVVYSPDMMQSTGEYLTRELNLKSLTFKGETTDFATRLYAYGSEGLTLEDATVDGKRYGLQYVENKAYCDKIICVYWNDDRYTDADSLYADAKKKIDQLAAPVRSYECSVVDLAKRSDKYSFLDFKLHKKVTLIDDERGLRVEHQIVEYVEYPDEPERNVITLSCVAEGIKEVISSSAAPSIDEAVKNMDTSFSQKILMATAMITGAFGGYVISDGSEIFIMDNEDPAKAEVVWRWNINGFGKSSTGIDGPYTTSLTFDDHFITNTIDAMMIRGAYIEAGTITAEKISQSFKGEITDEINDAKKEVTQSFTVANGELVSTIEAEVTRATEAESKLSSSIKQNADNITAEVTRAMGAETELSSKIELTAEGLTTTFTATVKEETDRATAVEENLVQRTTANAKAIGSETSRAIGAEKELSSTITQTAESLTTSFTATITAETDRAEKAEETLSSKITQNAEAITAEVARATGAEGTLSSKITQNADSITAEVARAKEEEGKLSSSISLNADNITAEVTRATEAESTLSTKITQTVDAIRLSVSSRTTNGETESTLSITNGSTVLNSVKVTGTTAEQASKIAVDAVKGITLSVTNSTTNASSTIAIKSGSTEISSAKIEFTGLVTFSDLKDGKTEISGDNIKTGTISADRIDVDKLKISSVYMQAGTYATEQKVVIFTEGTYNSTQLFLGGSKTWTSSSVNTTSILAASAVYLGSQYGSYNAPVQAKSLVFDTANLTIHQNHNSYGWKLGTSSNPFADLYTTTAHIGTNSSSSKIGFFGTTPQSKKTVNTASTSLSTTAANVATSLNALINALKGYGLIG